MIKTIGIVSLSAGTLGEDFVSHEVEIGLKRMREYGVNVKFLPHALKGRAYVQEHPEERAADLLQAFADPEIDMILCAVGGEDTYRLLPYLFDHDELKNTVRQKVFLGFSDTTVNHFMLRKVGLDTFYGQAFLPDVCEIDHTMLPYTEKFFRELIRTGSVREITPSPVWYEGRTDYGPDQIGKALPSHADRGFISLQGAETFSGKIFGGCLDTIYDMFYGERFEDMPILCQKYGLFPAADEWKGKILLLETSEEQMSPEKMKKGLEALKQAGVFGAVNGVLVGKPMDRIFEDEYFRVLRETIGDPDLPVVCNLNVGHALPRCIIPFGVEARVDVKAQRISFEQ